jgi:transcription elongation factor Elf1
MRGKRKKRRKRSEKESQEEVRKKFTIRVCDPEGGLFPHLAGG